MLNMHTFDIRSEDRKLGGKKKNRYKIKIVPVKIHRGYFLNVISIS